MQWHLTARLAHQNGNLHHVSKGVLYKNIWDNPADFESLGLVNQGFWTNFLMPDCTFFMKLKGFRRGTYYLHNQQEVCFFESNFPSDWNETIFHHGEIYQLDEKMAKHPSDAGGPTTIIRCFSPYLQGWRIRPIIHLFVNLKSPSWNPACRIA